MNEKGFTLIELLVVVIIIGILAAVAVPKLISNIEKSREGKAKGDIAAYEKALETYRASSLTQIYPSALTALHPTYMGGSSIVKSPWGNNYSYTTDGTEYTLSITSTASGGHTIEFSTTTGILSVH